MSLFSILETILIGPLKLVFDIVFSVANRFIGHPGLSIIFLSLVMNILVLPLYRRADVMQEEARDMDAKLQDGIAHIKKTFSGDERMMILQTYYRQNNYSPVSALSGSVSLLLEIPFFMAAYQFLSHLDVLDGVALGPITDLGAPDGLLIIGGLAINLLPILMTLINVISSAIYLKGFPLKTKVQLYAMALFFLVFLYNSPACLVFYWTLNNIFSLGKNIFYKLKNPQKVLTILTAALGIAVLGFVLFLYDTTSLKRKLLLGAIGLVLLMPAMLPLLKRLMPKGMKIAAEPNKKLFLTASVFLTVLVGPLISSAFVAASPQEFIDISYYYHPIWYVVSTTCMAAGTFLVWLRVFYRLADNTGKVVFEKLIWLLCGIMLMNYMFFGTELGVIYSNLQYERGLVFSSRETIINLIAVFVLAIGMLLVSFKWKKAATTILLTASIALCLMCGQNILTIIRSGGQIQDVDRRSSPEFTLSTQGQNVVVIMLDRAMGQYVPYIFQEKPELAQKFDGFTYYSNVISYGSITNVAAPALMGGYEYTPVELNKRDGELLVDKHNEAIQVMPVLFSRHGYDVTVLDPVYANYQIIPDLSIYNDYPEIDAYITSGRFDDTADIQTQIANRHRNFFCLSVMKTMPVLVQPVIYNNGRYNQSTDAAMNWFSIQITEGLSKSQGISSTFMSAYNILLNLPKMTQISDNEANTFLLMVNDTTHEPTYLQAPDYTPAQSVDNTQYDAAHADRFTVNGVPMKMENYHYHANMTAFLRLADWLDHLREQGVYDNTRIILVSDHGRDTEQLDALIQTDDSGTVVDMESYYPLLMVKDFHTKGFTSCEDFMTNADVPTLATDGVIDKPVNPFTGKDINSDEKYAHMQFISISDAYKVEENNGCTFLPSGWVGVENSVWNPDNRVIISDVITLKEHKAP